jgi:hypothetical protein
MVPSLDIFRVESGGVRWCEAATTLEIANACIQRLGLSAPGNYLIFNQTTGQRISVTPAGVPTPSEQLVESDAGRVDDLRLVGRIAPVALL